MNTITKLAIVFLSCVLLLGLVACGNSEESQGDEQAKSDQANSNENSQSTESESNANSGQNEPTTLTFAHGFAPNQSWAQAAEKFKEVVEEKTDGQLTIDIYDSGQLGEQRQLFEDIMASGSNDITITLEPISQWVPEVNLYQMLYLFDDIDHLREFEEGPIGQELKDLVQEETGVRTLTYFAREARQLTTTDKEVHSLDDIKGLKIRTTESETALAGWEALGAQTVPMAWGEVFTALQQGVIDGQENPLDHIYARQTYEVTPYGALTNHVYASVWLMISEEKYQSLPEEWQQVIDEAAAEAHKFERSLMEEAMTEVMENLEAEGFKITEPDLGPFREAVEPVYQEFPDLAPWVEKIKAIER